jgi:proline utilization trans-activator
MALSLGMNRQSPPGSLEKSEYLRRRRLWWTLYIIDRKLSINMGAPLTIHDEEIDISLPTEDDLGFDNSALILHIKLSAIEGDVMKGKTFSLCTFQILLTCLTAAYQINGALDKAFIISLQHIFTKMTVLVEHFDGKFDLSLEKTTGVSRVAATLQLVYYQVLHMTPNVLGHSGLTDHPIV